MVDLHIPFQDLMCGIDRFKTNGFPDATLKKEKQGVVANIGANVQNATVFEIPGDHAIVPLFTDVKQVFVVVIVRFGEDELLDVILPVKRKIKNRFQCVAPEKETVVLKAHSPAYSAGFRDSLYVVI